MDEKQESKKAAKQSRPELKARVSEEYMQVFKAVCAKRSLDQGDAIVKALDQWMGADAALARDFIRMGAPQQSTKAG